MGETAANMATPQAAAPTSPEETAPSPAWGQELSGEPPSQEAKKPNVLRIVLLGVAVLLVLCVICGVLANFVILPMLSSGMTIQP
jgi:hypothetical protein